MTPETKRLIDDAQKAYDEMKKEKEFAAAGEKQRADLAFLNNSSAIYSGLNSRKFIN